MPSRPDLAEPSAALPLPFRLLAWANLAAQSAEQIALAAAPLVAVLVLGAGPAETSLLQVFLTLPFVLVAIPAGLLADRFGRGELMAGAEAVRAVALLTILALLGTGALTSAWLSALGFAAVCGTVVFSVAAPALVPSLVPPGALALANARLELARTAAFAGGPALGGALVGFVGAPTAFGAAAALSAAAALVLRGVDEPSRPATPGRDPLRDIRQGAAFVFGDRLLAPVFATQVVFNTAFFVLFAVFVPYAVEHLGMSAQGVGASLGVYGVGMVAGALAAPRVMALLPFGIVIGIGPLCGFLASVAMAATVAWPSPILADLSLFWFGAGPILWVISTTTLRQSVTPPDLLGRVSAINIMSYGARPVGSALAAAVASWSGTEACLYLACAGFLLQLLIILLSPAVRLEARPVLA